MQRFVKAMKDCKWECMVVKSEEGYYWEIWSYENCGFDTRIKGRMKTTKRYCIDSLKEFVNKNSIQSIEPTDKPVRKLPLANSDQYAVVDNKDYKRAIGWNWYLNKGYVVGHIEGRNISLHRFVMNLTKNDGLLIDHVDRNPLNNTRSNLRLATVSQNIMNAPAFKNNKSGYRGVYLKEGLWCAKIQYKRKGIHIGYFHTAELAAKAYNKKAKELYGGFAYLNKAKGPYPKFDMEAKGQKMIRQRPNG